MENVKSTTSTSVSFANNELIISAHRTKRILIAYMVILILNLLTSTYY